MNKNKLNAWIAIAAASLACYFHFGSLYLAFLTTFVLAALLTPLRTLELVRDNTVDAELNLNTILDSAISAFKRAVFPITMFASVFRDVVLQGTDKIAVPYYPLEGSASRDFNQANGYVFDDNSATQMREVTINKRKYQPLHFTSRDLARMPMLNAQRIGQLKGDKLAYDVLADILSIITAANYGAPILTTGTNGFDSNAVVDIRTALNKIPWPEVGRGLMVNPDYDGALLKDNSFKAAYAIGTDQTVRTGRLPNVFGFEYASSNAVPTNGQNLVGFAAYMSAILVAFSPIEPADSIKRVLVDYQVATDPGTQISLEYRHWGDPDMDTDKRVIECNYGFDKGETAALKRITSA